MKLKWSARDMARKSAAALMAVAVTASFTPGLDVALAEAGDAAGGVAPRR